MDCSRSELGQKRSSRRRNGTSAMPPNADIVGPTGHVRSVPGQTASIDGTHRKSLSGDVARSDRWNVVLERRLVSRNSRSARSVSASSTVRSCRHCTDRRKSRAGRNSASRHHTRNNEEPGQYTKVSVRGSPNAASHLSGRKVAGRFAPKAALGAPDYASSPISQTTIGP